MQDLLGDAGHTSHSSIAVEATLLAAAYNPNLDQPVAVSSDLARARAVLASGNSIQASEDDVGISTAQPGSLLGAQDDEYYRLAGMQLAF
jgi:hypothetical protein